MTENSTLSQKEIDLLRGEDKILDLTCIIILSDGIHILGQLYVTNYQLTFIGSTESTKVVPKFQLPLGHIKTLKKDEGKLNNNFDELIEKHKFQGSRYDLYHIITHHNLKNFKILLKNTATAILDKFQNAINNGAHPIQNRQEPFAFAHFDQNVKNLNPFNLEKEYNRILEQAKDIWKISDINKNYKLCDKLPELIPIPVEATNELLNGVAIFRTNKFLPILSWIHPKTQVPLCRSAQPKICDPQRKNPKDKDYLRIILDSNPQANKLWIFDTRSLSRANTAFSENGGYELTSKNSTDNSDYENVELVFCDFAAKADLRTSLELIQEAFLFNNNFKCDKHKAFFVKIYESGWLNHVRNVLNFIGKIVFQIETCNDACLIHCSNGTDESPIFTSLSMLALDGYYRTIKGFQILIEKEFLSHSYPFQNFQSSEENTQLSPSFILFIDCVYQFIKQFPAAFEFDERLILEILQHSYSNMFGTFLYNGDKTRNEKFVAEKTLSLWTMINKESNIKAYRNLLYHPGKYYKHVIVPAVNLRDMTIFTAFLSQGLMSYLDSSIIHPKITSAKKLEKEIEILENQVESKFKELIANDRKSIQI